MQPTEIIPVKQCLIWNKVGQELVQNTGSLLSIPLEGTYNFNLYYEVIIRGLILNAICSP